MAERDPFDAELRRLLREKDRPIAPSSAFSDQLLGRLHAELDSSARGAIGATTTMNASIATGAAVPRPIGRPAVRPRALLSALGLAAVIVAMLIGLRLISDQLGHTSTDPTQGSQPAVLAAASPSPTTSDSLAMIGVDAGRNNAYGANGPASIDGQLWSFAGEGVAPPAYAAVVSGSTIYQVRTAANGESTGTNRDFLEAYDAATGRELWSVPVNYAGSPVVVGNLVIMAVTPDDADSAGSQASALLTAFSTADGSNIWSTPLPDTTYFYGFLQPIVVDGVVYSSGSNGTVTAVNAATGKLLWQSTDKIYTEPFDEGHPFPNAPASITSAGGFLYEVTPAGDLLALDPADGHLLWSLDIGDKLGIQSEATQLIGTEAGLLLVASVKPADTSQLPDSTVWTLFSPGTGDVIRSGELAGNPSGTAVIGSHLFVALRRIEAGSAAVTQLDLDSGETVGSRDLTGSAEVTGLVAAGSAQLYIVSETGQVVSFSTANLTQIASIDTGTFLVGDPLITDEAVIVRRHDRGLIALGTGGTPFASTPAPGGDGTANGGTAESSTIIAPNPTVLTDIATLDIGQSYETSQGTTIFGLDLNDAVAFDGVLYQSTGFPTEDQPVEGAISSTSVLRAVDLASGNTLWSFAGETIGAPVVTANSVYVVIYPTDNPPTPGPVVMALISLDAKTGAVNWRIDLPYADGYISAPPILVDSTVYAIAPDGTVYAADAATGSILWTSESAKPEPTTQTDDLNIQQTPNPAGQLAFGDGQLYVVAQDASVAALNPADGSLNWRFDTRHELRVGVDPMTILAVDGGVVISANEMPVTGNTAVTALLLVSADDGSIGWQKSVDAYVQSVLVSGTTLIVATGPSQDGTSILAIDTATGELTATGKIDPSANNTVVGQTLAEDHLCVVERNGIVAVLDSTTLETLDAYDLGQELYGAIVVTDDSILVGGEGTILVLPGAHDQ